MVMMMMIYFFEIRQKPTAEKSLLYMKDNYISMKAVRNKKKLEESCKSFSQFVTNSSPKLHKIMLTKKPSTTRCFFKISKDQQVIVNQSKHRCLHFLASTLIQFYFDICLLVKSNVEHIPCFQMTLQVHEEEDSRGLGQNKLIMCFPLHLKNVNAKCGNMFLFFISWSKKR